MKSLIFLVALIACVGCRNPYVDYYRDISGGKNLHDPNQFEQPNGFDLKHGLNPQEDEIRFMEDGFVMVGYSSFNGGNISNIDSGAVEQAVKVGASFCVVYNPKLTGSMQGSNSVYVPGRYASFAVTTPVQINRYDYLVTYWMKPKMKYVLGVRYVDLSSEEKAKYQTNKGVKIMAVVKGTPAYRADLLRGDIVKRIAGVEVEDIAHAAKILQENTGKTVPVIVRRGEELQTFDVSLN